MNKDPIADVYCDAETYRMNKPENTCVLSDGVLVERYNGKYGGGCVRDGKIDIARFYISRKISIFICRDLLHISDIRYAGKHDVWEYSSDPAITFVENIKNRHELETDKIEKILNSTFENCKFWKLVQARAKEIYYGGKEGI